MPKSGFHDLLRYLPQDLYSEQGKTPLIQTTFSSLIAYAFMGGRFMSIACHNYAATKIHTCIGTAHSREGGRLISTILIHSAKTTTAWINIDLDLETTSNHIMPDNIRRRRRRAKANAYVVWLACIARSLCISDRTGNEPSSDRRGTHEKPYWFKDEYTLNRGKCSIDILFMRAAQFKSPRLELFKTPHLMVMSRAPIEGGTRKAILV